MTRDDIIRMAQEAKLSNEIGAFGYPYLPELERFAILVAAKERENCAQVCESIAEEYAFETRSPDPIYCAAAIRARGEESSNG
jgi:hypothetical protein